MICRYCHKTAVDAPYCCFCGKKQDVPDQKKKRGNGQGCVYKLPNGKYKAVVTLGWYMDDAGTHRRTRSKIYTKRKDAVEGLVDLKRSRSEILPTFKELYDRWEPTHRVGKSTMDCYRAAIKYLAPVYDMDLSEITVDDLQDCIDDCGHGKRTPEEIGIHSLRCGNEPGMHEVIISTDYQTLSLKHNAESRAVFAEGAVSAARFIMNRCAGHYNMYSLVNN